MKGGKKEKWKNSMWSTSESRLADDSSSEDMDPGSAGWGPKISPERAEFRIEVNRTVMQSSAINVPDEVLRVAEDTPLPLSPRRYSPR